MGGARPVNAKHGGSYEYAEGRYIAGEPTGGAELCAWCLGSGLEDGELCGGCFGSGVEPY